MIVMCLEETRLLEGGRFDEDIYSMFQMYMNLFGKDNFQNNMIFVITKMPYTDDYQEIEDWYDYLDMGEWIDEM